MPDTTMTFFLTIAMYATVRWLEDDNIRTGWNFWAAAILLAMAILAKPVALVGFVAAYCALVVRRDGILNTIYFFPTYGFAFIALAPYVAYDAYVHSIAEWHWSSGITTLHVIPGLKAAVLTNDGFIAKARVFKDILGMLPGTMLGPVGTALAVLGACVMPKSPARTLLYSWLVAALLYAYVVVTVERVDYYLYLFLPLAALFIGGLAARIAQRPGPKSVGRPLWFAIGAACAIAALFTGERAIAPYYGYSKSVYRDATTLAKTLAPNALVVMGHYDPSILYYIDRKGWEEDPYVWTPFDEESAIAKGARYYVSVEDNRLKRNVELSNWLLRFPILDPKAKWPVYETDPAKMLPGAEDRWQTFRHNEKSGTL